MSVVKPTTFFQSVSRSRWCLAIYWLLLATGSHLPEFTLGDTSNQIGVFQIDKSLHVAGFAGLALLLYLSRLAGSKAPSFAHALAALLIGSVYALVDEYTQQFTGRHVSYSDVVAGAIAIIGVFLILTSPPPLDTRPRRVVIYRVVSAVLIVAALVLALVALLSAWGQGQPSAQPSGLGINEIVRFLIAGVLILLLVASQPAGVNRPRLGMFLSIVVIGLGGPIIESARLFTEQGIDMNGLYAHQLGLLTGMAALAVLAIIRHVRTNRPLTDQV